MINIIAPKEKKAEIEQLIAQTPLLKNKVVVQSPSDAHSTPYGAQLVINDKGILWPLFWEDILPPHLIPTINFSEKYLLATTLFLAGEHEEVFNLLSDKDSLLYDLYLIYLLMNYQSIPPVLTDFIQTRKNESEQLKYIYTHNEAILKHYGILEDEKEPPLKDILQAYEEALQLAPNPEWKGYTTKHYATLLIDLHQLKEAETLLRNGIDASLSDEARNALKSLLADTLIRKLTLPYDELTLIEAKALLQDTIEYEKQKNNQIGLAHNYTKAATLALMADTHTEALTYINTAIKLLEETDIEEFIAEAHRIKGQILSAWAQKGHPQFYKAAIKAYQKALTTFTKENMPQLFAEIHHQLGIIYSDFPTEDKKKSIMAGLSQTSFMEALSVYTKQEYPYMYATICNHFGNALCKFPPSIHTDNFQKALHYYNEALQIRTPQYPYERAITLLNYIEACWHVRNQKNNGQDLLSDMKRKAEEVLQLVQDETLCQEAQKHLDNIKKLKQISK